MNLGRTHSGTDSRRTNGAVAAAGDEVSVEQDLCVQQKSAQTDSYVDRLVGVLDVCEHQKS